MTTYLRKPWFWVFFTTVSFASFFLSLWGAELIAPSLDLQVTMELQEAIKEARQIAKQQHIGPAFSKSAASFDGDRMLQAYVELEAGGKQAWQKLIQDNLYQPYQWQVRLFTPNNPHEATLFFTPQGKKYGFTETLSENTALPNLSEQAAKLLAEKEAASFWGVKLSDYKLVTASQHTQPSARIDHTFTYERPHDKLKDAFYRLYLKVSGNQLTSVLYTVNTPEPFVRRYQEMRASNSTIASIGSVFFFVFYILGGIIACVIMLRRKWLLLKWPIILSSLIFILNIGSAISALPTSWLSYDTALSSSTFLLQLLSQTLLGALFQSFLMLIAFVAAEGLTRWAFPEHIQLWKVWSPNVANSTAILGRTVGAYLLTGVFLLYVGLFYYLTTTYLGWWTPLQSLTDPSILSNYLPAISPISMALQAGMMEECFCRAVPLSIAALLGRRYQKTGLFIGVTLVLQALIFGALHATYPNFPSYFRLVELLIPSFMFAGVYLQFGLMPAMLIHFVYDLILMSLPIWMASGTPILVSKALVLIALFLPLGIIVKRWLPHQTWVTHLQNVFNKDWLVDQTFTHASHTPQLVSHQLRKPLVLGTSIAALISLGVWLSTTQFKADAQGVFTSHEQASQLAQKALLDRGIKLDSSWKILPSIDTGSGLQDTFVWQEGGKEAYQQLLGTYLKPPQWNVRFAKFDGPVDARAEEYTVSLNALGHMTSFFHTYPENAVGASVSRDEAIKLAKKALKESYDLDIEKLTLISASPIKQPNRTDWNLTFSDKTGYTLSKGAGYISIQLAGKELAGYSRYVFVPEDWGREQQDKKAILSFFESMSSLVIYALVVCMMGYAFWQWAQKRFKIKAGLIVALCVALITTAQFLNGFPLLLASFNTSEPVNTQFFAAAASLLISLFVIVLKEGFLWGMFFSQATPRVITNRNTGILLAMMMGLIFTTAPSLSNLFLVPQEPLLPNNTYLENFSPSLFVIGNILLQGFYLTGFLLMLTSAGNWLTNHWQSRKLLGAISFIVLFICFTLYKSSASLPTFIHGGLWGAFFLFSYVKLLRFEMSLVAFYALLPVTLRALYNVLVSGDIQTAIPASGGILLLLAAIYLWNQKIKKPST